MRQGGALYALPFYLSKGGVPYIGCLRLLVQSLCLVLTLISQFQSDRVYVCGTEFSAVRYFYYVITIAIVLGRGLNAVNNVKDLVAFPFLSDKDKD